MEIIAIIVIALAGFWLFFFVFKRLLRMAIRLALLGAVVLALLAGAFAWWWYAPLERSASQNRSAPGRTSRPSR
jgi:hypothetical protein